MAQPSGQQDQDTGASKSLPNRPGDKMAPIPKGSRVQKRPLPGRFASFPKRVIISTRTANPITRDDSSGYIAPPRASHTVVIYVSSGAPFMSIVSQARKALANAPQPGGSSTKGLPFTKRMEALRVRSGGDGRDQHQPTDHLDDVVLVGTGRAIQKTVELGAYFLRDRRELFVVPRTSSVPALDDVVMADDVDEEDQTRVRMVSCVEIGLRWK